MQVRALEFLHNVTGTPGFSARSAVKCGDSHGGGMRNNEIVLDARDYAARLPDSIEGFFYQVGDTASQQTRAIQERFVAHYGYAPQHAPPLMELDLKDGGDRPFRLVSL